MQRQNSFLFKKHKTEESKSSSQEAWDEFNKLEKEYETIKNRIQKLNAKLNVYFEEHNNSKLYNANQQLGYDLMAPPASFDSYKTELQTLDTLINALNKEKEKKEEIKAGIDKIIKQDIPDCVNHIKHELLHIKQKEHVLLYNFLVASDPHFDKRHTAMSEKDTEDFLAGRQIKFDDRHQSVRRIKNIVENEEEENKQKTISPTDYKPPTSGI